MSGSANIALAESYSYVQMSRQDESAPLQRTQVARKMYSIENAAIFVNRLRLAAQGSGRNFLFS